MSHDVQYVIGIDVGTGGVRALAVSAAGDVAIGASVALDAATLAPQRIGTEWINQRYPGGYPHALDAEAAQCLPCDVLAYPLARHGERFPFLSSSSVGFVAPPTEDAATPPTCKAPLSWSGSRTRCSTRLPPRREGIYLAQEGERAVEGMVKLRTVTFSRLLSKLYAGVPFLQ